jgi:hypothetical protein
MKISRPVPIPASIGAHSCSEMLPCGAHSCSLTGVRLGTIFYISESMLA